MKLKINKDLLPIKGHFFLFTGGISPVQPLMQVMAKELNFPSNAVGIIYGVLPVAGMLAKPIFGAIADRYRLHKVVFICFQILTILGFFNVQFISKIEKTTDEQVKLVCGAETNFDFCLKDSNKYTECLMHEILNESKTINCSLRCDLTPDLRTELCESWGSNPNICRDDIIRKTEYTHVKEEENPVPLSDSLRHSNNSVSTRLDDVKLDFVATVPLKHTLKVADCFYFRVSKALLNDDSLLIPYCKKETDTQCRIHCQDSKLSELLSVKESDHSDVDFLHHYQFWVFFYLAIMSWVGMAVVGSLADAVCFEMLGEKSGHYGYQRLWGSVGWGVFAIISGLVVDKFSKEGQTNYTPSFYFMLVLIIGDVICSYNLKYEQTKVSPNIFKNVGKLLKDVWIDIFFVWCIFLGICVGVQWNFLFWYLKDLMACDQESSKTTLLGLASGVQCLLGEIPSFFLFNWIVKKIGHVHVMTIIPFIIGIRFILYSIIPNAWWALPIELLQFAVGLSFATMASYASIVAPPGTEATVQGLVGAIFEGIGVSLGSYLGGIILKQQKGSVLFQIFGIVAFGWCLIHGLIHYFLGRNSKLQTQAKDFNGIAKYATPNDAVSMLEDT